MVQITARMPEELVAELDAAARRQRRSRAEVLRQAAESYLEDDEDLRIARERLEDPNDPILDWDEVRRELVTAARSPAPGRDPLPFPPAPRRR